MRLFKSAEDKQQINAARSQGLLEAITTFEGAVLDGRNRLAVP